MYTTGHGKEYAYYLGSEADIYIIEGVVALILWIIALFPVSIWLETKFYRIQKKIKSL